MFEVAKCNVSRCSSRSFAVQRIAVLPRTQHSRGSARSLCMRNSDGAAALEHAVDAYGEICVDNRESFSAVVVARSNCGLFPRCQRSKCGEALGQSTWTALGRRPRINKHCEPRDGTLRNIGWFIEQNIGCKCLVSHCQRHGSGMPH
jgi:hypothetical protein